MNVCFLCNKMKVCLSCKNMKNEIEFKKGNVILKRCISILLLYSV